VTSFHISLNRKTRTKVVILWFSMKLSVRLLTLFLPICISGCHSPNPFPATSMDQSYRAEIHYSPEEDLERIDINLIHGAQRTIDMPMYAFTDRYLAEALLDRANHGVKIRLYRDQGQFDEETGRRFRRDATEDVLSMLKRQPHIQIRVKGSSTLLHLKSYCIDNRVLRDGSANWSPSGEKRQDNSLVIVTNAAAIEHFEQIFNQIWNRSDNRIIQ
jgi:phosphatidylserine/phosphatidylglycerophosphate/cardiolipin synthase-like enzyme